MEGRRFISLATPWQLRQTLEGSHLEGAHHRPRRASRRSAGYEGEYQEPSGYGGATTLPRWWEDRGCPPRHGYENEGPAQGWASTLAAVHVALSRRFLDPRPAWAPRGHRRLNG